MDLLLILLSGKWFNRRGAEDLCFHSGIFHGSAKVALETLSCRDLIWLSSVSCTRGDAAGVFQYGHS